MGLVAAPNVGEFALVERDDAMRAIDAALARARLGHGVLLFFEGPAGIGKTGVLKGARERARHAGMAVFSGRGTEFELEYPFGVLRQCLAPAVRRQEDRERLLRGAAGPAEPALLDADVSVEASRFGLLNGLYWLVAALGDERPAVLLIDGAHWADESSLRFLGYVARRIETLPVALIVAARTVVDFSSSPRALQEVRDHARGESAVHELRSLSSAGVSELLAAARRGPVDESFVDACLRATGGNPFLLDALVRSLDERGVPFGRAAEGRVAEVSPPEVKSWVAGMLGRLSPEGRALAHAVAMLGDGTGIDLAAELAGIGSEVAAPAAAELMRAGVLGDDAPLRFRHPILGGAVRDNVSVYERASAHTRAVELLRARGAAPERIALQLLQVPAGDDRRVVRELRRAAGHARARGAPATAIVLLRRALDEQSPPPERAAVLVELGRVEIDEGRPSQACDHLMQAYECADDPGVRGTAVALLANAVPVDPDARRRVVDLAERTLPEVAEHDRELALRLRANLVLEGRALDDVDVPGDTVAEAVLLGHLVFARMTPDARAEDIAEIARRGARQVDALVEEGAIALGFTGIALGLRWTDQLDLAERALDRAIEAARRRGSTSDFAMALTQRAAVHRRAGRLRDAEGDARLALAADVEEPLLFARGIAPLVVSLLDQGQPDAAAQQLAAVVGDTRELPDLPPMTPVLLARMALQAAGREYGQALDTWREASRRASRSHGGIAASWIEDLSIIADVHHAVGDTAAACATADYAREVAERWGTPGARGQALHAQARVGALPAPIEALEEAVTLLARSPARLEHARALVTLGGALRRSGRRVDSRAPLRDGYDLAVLCGAQALAESARSELRSSGVRVRREPRSGVDALTASEQRIAEMAADGMSNAEIAQRLFLTVKTVEMHLTHTYRKLDVTGRPDLTRALGSEQ